MKSFLFHAIVLTACFMGTNAEKRSIAPPRIFFTDLDSGPNSGGQNDKGVFVTIYGRRFGVTQGNSGVTIGGGLVDNCPVWSDSRITCQLGARASSGPVIVKVDGRSSNETVTFNVRSGRIFFASPQGVDSRNGSYASPFRTILKCRDAMRAGDTCYLEDGLSQNTNDGSGWHSSMLLRFGGKPGAPIAFVAYPNAGVSLGDPGGCSDRTDQKYGIRSTAEGGNSDAWITLSGGGGNWTVIGGCVSAVGINDNGGWRVVGLKITCPNGNAPEGCFEASLGGDPRGVKVYGNEITGVSTNLSGGSSKQYHAAYFTTDTNHIDFGWNDIHDNRDCRALQFHSSPIGRATGQDQFDLHVHDNVIHDDPCDGINFATVDPSKGVVEAYNNLIYRVGKGPAPPDGDANYACIYSPGKTNRGSAGKGQILVYNNTMYDCGARAAQLNAGWGGALGSFDSGSGLFIKAQNNIIYQIAGESYLQEGSNAVGDHNLFFGAGMPPGGFSNSFGADPQFVNLGVFDFHLSLRSPAIGAGVNTGIVADLDGILRPEAHGYSVGAFELPLAVTTISSTQANRPVGH